MCFYLITFFRLAELYWSKEHCPLNVFWEIIKNLWLAIRSTISLFLYFRILSSIENSIIDVDSDSSSFTEYVVIILFFITNTYNIFILWFIHYIIYFSSEINSKQNQWNRWSMNDDQNQKDEMTKIAAIR